jgi:CspA family cold shock protein
MAQRSTGVVKWFNNKAGYGFLTLIVDGQTPEDIFVHHSEIQVGKDQYKYLVQGEYVEFVLSADAGQHKSLATGVRGVNGGRLMCETRNDTRSAHPPREREHGTSSHGTSSHGTSSHGTSSHGTSSHGTSSRGSGTRGRGGYHTTSLRPPIQTDDDQVEWLLVKRKRNLPHAGTGTGTGRGRRPGTELS